MTMKIAKKIKERTGWIYECRFLSKKISDRLYPNWDWDYYKKHFYRSLESYVRITSQHRIKIFNATQSLANHLLGFERPFWYFAKEFHKRRYDKPPDPCLSSVFRPRSYKYRRKAKIHHDARSYVRNPEEKYWIPDYYNEDHPEWSEQFNAEVERQKSILAKAQLLKEQGCLKLSS